MFFAVSALILCSNNTSAGNFTLRNLEKGDLLKSFTASTYTDKSNINFSPLSGKPTLLVFFSVAPNYRLKKSLELLGQIEELLDEYDEKVNFYKIYSDKVENDDLEKLIRDGLISSPIINDKNQEIYNSYGVFMTPVVVLSTSQGKLHEVIPATHNIKQIVNNNLKLLTGEWTLDDFKNSFKFKFTKTWTNEEKEYLRRVNYGKIMLARKMYSPAIREFSTAAKILPGKPEAPIGLGQAYLKKGSYSKAEKSFSRAIEIDPESDAALAGQGVALYKMGQISKALPILESALITDTPSLDVVTTLAEIYEERGNMTKSLRLNKLALDILLHKKIR